MLKNGKRKKSIEAELGYASFYCEDCKKEFEVSWYDIFMMQEATHGFVGYYIEQEYIVCPKCGGNVNKMDRADDFLPPGFIPYDKLPF
jgi:Zn finger protein HypA/HybF involved in hydrogenase expression